MAKARVSAEEFVRAWQTSNSMVEVAEKTGMSIVAVSSRVAMYRRKGVPLKPYRIRKIDWEALASYAAEQLGDTDG